MTITTDILLLLNQLHDNLLFTIIIKIRNGSGVHNFMEVSDIDKAVQSYGLCDPFTHKKIIPPQSQHKT